MGPPVAGLKHAYLLICSKIYCFLIKRKAFLCRDRRTPTTHGTQPANSEPAHTAVTQHSTWHIANRPQVPGHTVVVPSAFAVVGWCSE